MANLNVLKTYALKDPATLPDSILFGYTDTTLVVFDAYPKSIFHFLVLPRVNEPLTVADLTNLRSLINKDGVQAQVVIQGLKDAAESLKKDIEDEMIKRYGFKWEIWTGFHAAPSMPHVHLHVLSADLCSERTKNKKHYNSFHPNLGFFLDIDLVISWLTAAPSFNVPILNTSVAVYEKLLKEPLSCFRCNKMIKNMPTLRQHLQEEWETLAEQEKSK
ncbi:hypothetical protein AX17_003532 [Amanita inopinata Kibby_2008]|nr:hypothetical protein AX17_003532 [Amanita inopinata Kibby_2008]